jgi:hypothetical protein
VESEEDMPTVDNVPARHTTLSNRGKRRAVTAAREEAAGPQGLGHAERVLQAMHQNGERSFCAAPPGPKLDPGGDGRRTQAQAKCPFEDCNQLNPPARVSQAYANVAVVALVQHGQLLWPDKHYMLRHVDAAFGQNMHWVMWQQLLFTVLWADTPAP